MGINHQLSDQLNVGDWELKQVFNDVKVWGKVGDPNTEIEQHRLYFNDPKQFQRSKQTHLFRKDHPFLVASKFFKQQTKDSHLCSAQYKGNLYIERIPLKLSNVKDIPFPDCLHIYSHALQGFEALSKEYSFFFVSQGNIGIRKDGVVKVWFNTSFQKSQLSQKKCSEENMVRSIFETIEGNLDSDFTKKRSVLNYIYSHQKPIYFKQAIQYFCQYADQHNEGYIPSRLNCVNSLGGVDTIINQHLIKNQIEPIKSPNKSVNIQKPIRNSQPFDHSHYIHQQFQRQLNANHFNTINYNNITNSEMQNQIMTTPTSYQNSRRNTISSLYQLPQKASGQVKIIPKNMPQLQSPRIQSKLVQSPHLQSPHLQSPHLQSPHIQSPNIQSPIFKSPNFSKTPNSIFQHHRILLTPQQNIFPLQNIITSQNQLRQNIQQIPPEDLLAEQTMRSKSMMKKKVQQIKQQTAINRTSPLKNIIQRQSKHISQSPMAKPHSISMHYEANLKSNRKTSVLQHHNQINSKILSPAKYQQQKIVNTNKTTIPPQINQQTLNQNNQMRGQANSIYHQTHQQKYIHQGQIIYRQQVNNEQRPSLQQRHQQIMHKQQLQPIIRMQPNIQQQQQQFVQIQQVVNGQQIISGSKVIQSNNPHQMNIAEQESQKKHTSKKSEKLGQKQQKHIVEHNRHQRIVSEVSVPTNYKDEDQQNVLKHTTNVITETNQFNDEIFANSQNNKYELPIILERSQIRDVEKNIEQSQSQIQRQMQADSTNTNQDHKSSKEQKEFQIQWQDYSQSSPHKTKVFENQYLLSSGLNPNYTTKLSPTRISSKDGTSTPQFLNQLKTTANRYSVSKRKSYYPNDYGNYKTDYGNYQTDYANYQTDYNNKYQDYTGGYQNYNLGYGDYNKTYNQYNTSFDYTKNYDYSKSYGDYNKSYENYKTANLGDFKRDSQWKKSYQPLSFQLNSYDNNSYSSYKYTNKAEQFGVSEKDISPIGTFQDVELGYSNRKYNNYEDFEYKNYGHNTQLTPTKTQIKQNNNSEYQIQWDPQILADLKQIKN